MSEATQKPSTQSNPEHQSQFELIKHGHQDLVQAVAYNEYGDRLATGAVDGKIRVFNRHKDAVWVLQEQWQAHAGEVLELMFLPQALYPSLIASLGIEGRFKLWPEDPTAARQRFGHRKPAFDHRSSRSPYRSFSMRYDEDSRHTYLALLSNDGQLSVFENEMAENLSNYAPLDSFSTCGKPSRGEETSFRVRFDPNPDLCYKALRAGMPSDTLGLVVAAMNSFKIYRTRDVVKQSYGLAGTARVFYQAAEITLPGLIRDVAWANGSFRGYDILACACADGYVRVLHVDTPYDDDDGKTWSSKDITKRGQDKKNSTEMTAAAQQSNISTALSSQQGTDTTSDRKSTSAQGHVEHVVTEIAKLDVAGRAPMWRCEFDADGAVLGAAGDDGKLHLFRQAPSGTWLKSSELGIARMKMSVPTG